MEAFLNLDKNERTQLFQEATARYPGIEDPIIIEKDFWICWVLWQLYSIPELNSNITFKGGTSLSKCFGIIERFSEDCDLTIDKAFIGINEENDPRAAKSNSQRRKRLKNLNDLVIGAVNNTIKPMLSKSFRNALGSNYGSETWKLVTDDSDLQTLLFYYPSSLGGLNKNDYILPAVKLEFGARADRLPSQNLSIQSYLESAIPEAFNSRFNIRVDTLSPERTFWEKVTLLHAEHHRSTEKNIPKRLFRHYYDITMLDQHNITQKALENFKLLSMVVENKKTFFDAAWANYKTANIGTLKLYPNKHFISDLQRDCIDMADMFFGEPPSFDSIMRNIDQIEKVINEHKEK